MADLRCSFCLRGQKDVRKLIAGPTVYVCDDCVAKCNAIMRKPDDIALLPNGPWPVSIEDGKPLQKLDRVWSCGFCGKRPKDVKAIFTSEKTCICDECVGLCNDIIAEEVEKVGPQENNVEEPKSPNKEEAERAHVEMEARRMANGEAERVRARGRGEISTIDTTCPECGNLAAINLQANKCIGWACRCGSRFLVTLRFGPERLDWEKRLRDGSHFWETQGPYFGFHVRDDHNDRDR